jgi:hypothetical protein
VIMDAILVCFQIAVLAVAMELAAEAGYGY